MEYKSLDEKYSEIAKKHFKEMEETKEKYKHMKEVRKPTFRTIFLRHCDSLIYICWGGVFLAFLLTLYIAIYQPELLTNTNTKPSVDLFFVAAWLFIGGILGVLTIHITWNQLIKYPPAIKEEDILESVITDPLYSDWDCNIFYKEKEEEN